MRERRGGRGRGRSVPIACRLRGFLRRNNLVRKIAILCRVRCRCCPICRVCRVLRCCLLPGRICLFCRLALLPRLRSRHRNPLDAHEVHAFPNHLGFFNQEVHAFPNHEVHAFPNHNFSIFSSPSLAPCTCRYVVQKHTTHVLLLRIYLCRARHDTTTHHISYVLVVLPFVNKYHPGGPHIFLLTA